MKKHLDLLVLPPFSLLRCHSFRFVDEMVGDGGDDGVRINVTRNLIIFPPSFLLPPSHAFPIKSHCRSIAVIKSFTPQSWSASAELQTSPHPHHTSVRTRSKAQKCPETSLVS